MSSPREILVERDIQLVHVRPDSANEIFGLIHNNREFLSQWMPWVTKTSGLEDTVKFLKEAEEKYHDKKVPTYKIVFKGNAVGIMGFNHINEENGCAAIGYWLAPQFTGRGIMTKCCAALVDLAFNFLKLNKVEIAAAPGNAKSRAIAERLGFKEEGTLRQRELQASGEYTDLVYYGLLRSEYKKADS